MRTALILLSSFVLLLCSCKEKVKQPPVTTEFDYLIGDWERTNSKGGSATSEHWRAVTSEDLRGHGYTIEDEDTVFNERMRIYKKQEQWMLSINGPNENPTLFKITQHTNSAFTAVNPDNEFPKVITYSYFDDVLTATISAEDTEIPFIFWRMED